jgi:hypothetical protein
MRSLADPTVPDRDEFIAGGKWAGLDHDLDDIAKGLSSGTPEAQRAKFYARILALSKKHDLHFHDIWSRAMSRHPELNESEDLNPTEYAPKLQTRTAERKAQAALEKKLAKNPQKATAMGLIEGFEHLAHENRLAKIKELQASDPELTFAAAWDQTETIVEIPLPVARPQTVQPLPVARPETVQAEELDLPPGVYLVHGRDAGLTCPLF